MCDDGNGSLDESCGNGAGAHSFAAGSGCAIGHCRAAAARFLPKSGAGAAAQNERNPGEQRAKEENGEAFHLCAMRKG